MSTPLLALWLARALAAPLDAPPLPGDPIGAWDELEDPTSADPLTPEEAVRLALERNGELRAALAEVDRARGDRLTARALPNPEVSVGLWSDDTFGVSEVEVELAVRDAVLAPLRGRPAGAALDRARAEAAAEAVRLGFEVRAAFYAAQAAEARAVAAARAVDAWAAGVETGRALFEAGNVPELDLAVQETEYERARVTLAELELEVVAARERLARLIGAEERRPLAPAPSPDALATPEGLEDRAVAASLELRAADATVEGSRAALAVSRAALIVPEFGLYGTTGGFGEAWDLEAGVHLTVPLFAPGVGAVTSAAAGRDAATALRAQRELEVRSAAREALARLVSARDRAVHFDTVVVPARERVSRQTLLQYNAMQVGVYPLLDARRQELEARATAAALRAEAWTAQAAVEALLAGVRVDAPAPSSSSTPGPAASAAGGH